MRYYLGIDGGQSSTTALIADETGQVVGSGSSGPCNHVTSSEAAVKFRSVVGECIAAACRQAAIDPAATEFAAACLGFSGGAADKESYSRELIRSARIKVTHDAEIALSGATAGEPGIIVIAGTGSIAFGRNAEGRTARAGGWGYIFGDEGGAFDLVRRALRAALRMEEGWGPETTLRTLLLEATKAANANDVLHAFYSPEYPRSRIAQLAPAVTHAAEEGDAVAVALLDEAADQLTRYAAGVYRNLFHAEIVPVAYIGGVFQSALVLDGFSKRLQQAIACPVIAPRLNPAAGAVLDAMRLDGNSRPLSARKEMGTLRASVKQLAGPNR